MSIKRKEDHIALTPKAQLDLGQKDSRFNYEPLMSGHLKELEPFTFLDKQWNLPIWASSMTGGAQNAKQINKNIAKVCQKFGMGMGLGSCRSLLDSTAYLKDFDVRKYIGDDLPLYANLGVGQLEQLISENKLNKIKDLLDMLSADGLIIHINPLQELTQEGGDRFQHSPLASISTLIEKLEVDLIVKEVGQGMGPSSMDALLGLPLKGIEFGALGGTNFALLELLRQESNEYLYPFVKVGHSAEEMVGYYNNMIQHNDAAKSIDIIISGGIQNYLDGYYLTSKIQSKAVYGQASSLLKYAKEGYEPLEKYISNQKHGLEMANAFLQIKK